jgi:hypothetical protein
MKMDELSLCETYKCRILLETESLVEVPSSESKEYSLKSPYQKTKMDNHNKLETVVVDNKPSRVNIGRFPMFADKGHSNKATLRSNRYLSYQSKRIMDALTAGKVEKAVLI